jgi:tetratricopeptide (TPR) repeat protein
VLAPSLSPSQQLEIALWRYRRGRDLGLPDEVAHATEVGMRVAEASGDPLLIDKAAHMRVDLLRGQGHLEEAAARAEAAFRRLMAADAPHLAGPLAQMRAAIAVAAHQHEVAVAWCETAVAHLDPVRESQAWMMHAGSCQHLDRPQQARQSIERALAMASKHGDERQLIRIHTVAANLAAQSGDYPRAIAVYEEMLAAAELLAAKPVIAHVTYNCGLALHYCGRHEEGRRSTARTIAVYIELRMPLRLHRAQALHGLSHLFIGDSEEAWRLCQPGLEEPGTVTLAARVAGDAALRLDRPEDALRIGTVGLRAVEAGEHGYQGAFLALCAVARHRLGIADDLGAVEASLSVGWSNADPDPIAAHAWLAEVYRAHGNPRATRITLLARRILQRRAALLSDPAARAGFLSCSAAHRAFTAG